MARQRYYTEGIARSMAGRKYYSEGIARQRYCSQGIARSMARDARSMVRQLY